jgi:hypothetical protein
MSKVYVNGRTAVHKGDNQVNTGAVPDVCKTPSPGGPVPVPYVNVARDSDLSNGSKSVSIEGNPVALANSNLGTSSGDEPGTAGGGLISSKTKGKMTWGCYSIDVKMEGKGVARFLDVTQHNGNTFNTAFTQQGGTGLAYGDDPVEGRTKCPICKKPKPDHRILETQVAQGTARDLLRALMIISKEKGLGHTLKLDDDGLPRNGYMIGVLTCKGGQKIYAAMSGRAPYVDGFKDAVSLLQAKDSRWTLCQPLGPTSVIRNPRGDEIPIAKMPVVPGGKPAGACAAPQLLQKAQGDGHIPGAMSEVWYRPRVLKRHTQGQQIVKVTFFKNGKQMTSAFAHGESVPSYKTCQVHLTQMLCDVNEKTCA